MKKAWPQIIPAILILLLTAPCPDIGRAADEASPVAGDFHAYRPGIGITFRNVELDISDTDTLKTLALLEGDYVPWPYLSFRSPVRYFENSKVGWLVEYGLSGFSIDKQSEPFTESKATQRGTFARGWFLYAVPTLTWDVWESLKVGLGLGAGILSVTGDALIYDPYPTVAKIDYSLTRLSYGGYFLTEYSFGDFMVGIHAGVLIATRGSYDYTISDGSVIFAYRITL